MNSRGAINITWHAHNIEAGAVLRDLSHVAPVSGLQAGKQERSSRKYREAMTRKVMMRAGVLLAQSTTLEWCIDTQNHLHAHACVCIYIHMCSSLPPFMG